MAQASDNLRYDGHRTGLARPVLVVLLLSAAALETARSRTPDDANSAAGPPALRWQQQMNALQDVVQRLGTLLDHAEGRGSTGSPSLGPGLRRP